MGSLQGDDAGAGAAAAAVAHILPIADGAVVDASVALPSRPATTADGDVRKARRRMLGDVRRRRLTMAAAVGRGSDDGSVMTSDVTTWHSDASEGAAMSGVTWHAAPVMATADGDKPSASARVVRSATLTGEAGSLRDVAKVAVAK